jgi:enoyl-CoA hydratase/carnithine racemase
LRIIWYDLRNPSPADGVAFLSLHRLEVHNALNQKLRDELGTAH